MSFVNRSFSALCVSLISNNSTRFNFHCRTLDEAARLFMRSKQRFNLFAQRLVTGAGIVKKRSAFATLALEREVKQLIELLPVFRLH